MATAPITLVSPVAGLIHEQSWANFGKERPRGNHDWRLTKTASQHAKTGVKAIDLGDGDPDRDNCYAIIAGTVVEWRTRDGVITIETFDHQWRVVSAHLAIDALFNDHPKGTKVGVGTVIGHVSNTYPPPTVLLPHWHGQVGRKVDGAWVWQDPWPLLAINQFAVLNGVSSNIRVGPSKTAKIFAVSRAEGIMRAGVKIAELNARMKVLQPPFAAGDGLVWAHVSLNGQEVYIWKNLVHFEL